MTTPRRQLLDYAEFLRESGNLYLEPDAEGRLPIECAASPAPAESAPPARTPRPAPPSAGASPPPRPTRKDTAPAMTDANQLDFASESPAPQTLGGEELEPAAREARGIEAAARAEACRACALGSTRSRAVYGVGSLTAKIVFVGEAPGAEEDRQGIPFVGRAGQLLTKMIEAIGFKREEIYICNTLKCRPPDNRDPLPGEKAACQPFLIEQLQIIRPQMLVALGAHAATYLTGKSISIGKLRGAWHAWHGVPVLATYHPAFLLRSPGFKAKGWEDMQTIAARYNELNPEDRREVWKKG